MKTDVKCPKCGKLIAKLKRNGMCKGMLLYCRSCKKEYEITINENLEKENRANEPNN